jgi:S1-C subfamily serine protease
VAAWAGLKAGDVLVSLANQPLVSMADFSWVLHRAPESGTLSAVVKRGGSEKPLKVELPAGWRERSSDPRRVGTWNMRGMATGGLVLEDLPDDVRAARGLNKQDLALLVKFVGQYGSHAAAKNAGFKKDDVLVQVADVKSRRSEGELIGELLQKHFPGEKVSTTVLRGTERIELKLPMQ